MCILRPLEQDRELLVADATLCASSQPPLFDNDTTLFIDLVVFITRVVRPILQHLETLLYDGRSIGRQLQFINSLVKTCGGIQVRAETHADRLEIIHELLLLEM